MEGRAGGSRPRVLATRKPPEGVDWLESVELQVYGLHTIGSEIVQFYRPNCTIGGVDAQERSGILQCEA